eukprot:94443-Pyramimonas_sp.AAC.1
MSSSRILHWPPAPSGLMPDALARQCSKRRRHPRAATATTVGTACAALPWRRIALAPPAP